MATALALLATSACARTEPEWGDPDAGADASTDTATVDACVYIGGYDRFVVTGIWPRTGECLKLVFIDAPSTTPYSQFRAPPPWLLATAFASPVDCSPTHMAALDSAKGELVFDVQAEHDMPTLFSLVGEFRYQDASRTEHRLHLDARTVPVSATPCAGPF